MKKRIVKGIALITVGVLAAASFAGCGKKASDSGVKKVVVGMGNAWAPCDYIDADGNPAGYEYEVLKAVDELLPEYEFDIQPMDFGNILVALDTGKIEVASHTFTLNEERKAKYDYTEESHYQNKVVTVVSKDNNDIHGIEDLAGKKVFAATGEATGEQLEQWNADHPDKKIDLKYEAFTMEQVVAEISSGTMDAWYCNPSFLDDLNKNYGDKLKAADGEPLLVTDSIFYLKKGDTELKKAIDGAIKTLKENGTLTKLSNDTIGYDASGTDSAK